MLESVLYPRGHDCTVVKGLSRLDVRKCSLSQRTINVWNKLSTDCVRARQISCTGGLHLEYYKATLDKPIAYWLLPPEVFLRWQSY